MAALADPKNKYAGLPGIASPDEKDVYETEDLPEADQDDYLVEAESENIERPHLNVRTAHEKFRGKNLIPSQGMDFSDAARRRRHVGYQAISGDWEIAAEGEPETLLQRRHRLEAEFRLLIEDLNELKNASKEKDQNEAVLAETLVPELEESLRQISQLQVPDCSADLTATPAQHISNIQNLIKQLNENEKKKAAGKIKGESGQSMTYQLNMYPAQAQLVKSARLADLELRIKQVEAVLGATPENLNRFQLSEFKSISEAVSELSARTNVLDLTAIDTMDTKLGSLVSKMNTIVEKKGGPQQVEFEAKVNELYDSYKKVEALTQSILPIADRLSALGSLHQEAGEFKKTIAQLKLEMENISNKVAADEAVVDSIKVGMKELMETVTNNIANFNNRLLALKK